MKKISIEELPNWFRLQNYDKARQFTIKDWALQLEHRSWLDSVADRNEELADIENSHRFNNFYGQIQKGGHISDERFYTKGNSDPEHFVTGEKIRYGSIRLITCNEIARYSSDLTEIEHLIDKWECREQLSDEELKYALHSYDGYVLETAYNPFGLLHAQIDIKATDEQILSDISNWLPIMRKKFDLDNVPTKNYNETDFRKWANYRVLAYLDLILWAKVNQKKIPDHVMGNALFPEESNVDTTEKIRKTIRPLCNSLLLYRVIDALWNQSQ